MFELNCLISTVILGAFHANLCPRMSGGGAGSTATLPAGLRGLQNIAGSYQNGGAIGGLAAGKPSLSRQIRVATILTSNHTVLFASS